MKHDRQRPRGRRTVLRGCALALLALVAPGVASDAAQGAEQAPRISRTISPAWAEDQLAAGPDGKVWSLERSRRDSAFAVARYDASGRLGAVKIPGVAQLTPLTPLADGTMGVVTSATPPWEPTTSVSLTRVSSGRTVHTTPLPRAARRADAFAIGGDGAVWFAASCEHELSRWRAGERLLRVRLPGADCANDRERTGSLSIGPDGSVWFASASQARIVRRDVRGRMRSWGLGRPHFSYSQPVIAPDPRGGGAAVTDRASYGSVAGLVTRSGRLISWDDEGLSAFGADGTLWHADEAGLTAVSQNGATRLLPLPAPLGADAVTTDVAIARDGAPWYLAGVPEIPPSIDTYLADVRVGTVAPGGRLAAWSLSGRPDQLPTQVLDPTVRLVLGGDGALWTRAEHRWITSQVMRVAPPGLRAPRRPTARATRVSARGGRVVTLQLSCAAERGRFCRGTVRLRDAAAAVRYIAPGQSGAAVRLTLSAGAAGALRRGRAVRTTAITTSGGAATTRAALTVRPR